MTNLSPIIQCEAKTIWDLVVADTCNCVELHKPCNELIMDGEYKQVKLPCGYACESLGTKVLYHHLLKDNDLLKETYPIYWKKVTFKGEVNTVLGWLNHWDPNGDWDEQDVLLTPIQTIRTLENLKAELEDNYQDVPGWIDSCIDYLLLFIV